MAQQNTADDGSTDAQNDPELAAANLAEAADSLQTHMTRSEMRSAAREWDTKASGTKQEMAEDMLENAQEQALALLVEEGVELLGDLADDEADEAEDEQEAQEQEDDEDEQDSEDSTQDTPGSLAGDLLARSPEDYGYTAKLQMTAKQTAAVKAAFEDLDATQAEVAEAADCTERYANSTLNRWRGTEDEVQAMEDEGIDVPAEFMEHEVLD
ncbi:hypothetical protein M201_gp57 [Haloarcula californiae tailed virus 2]|uniref:SAP domain-containing protein n=1 Tax=Haloarcula californiae tailed virus 2 TaxID=1273747 RepID=R4THP0_9CAUD|nr:hypothetical protein M201_gp57 [Haloarcula californiae tailed virus 2]AGM11826.1 hypothetical protein HCTV2_57 [Haloarcula californiae tailed virus 2]